MKRLLVSLVLASAVLAAPAYAAVTPSCTYGGSGITQATNGAIVIISAVDNTCIFTPLAVGSSGQVLTSNGANTLPSFAAGGGGPTLAGTNNWTGTNNYGAAGVNNGSLINIKSGVSGGGDVLNIGADKTQTCLGSTGNLLAVNDSFANGPFMLVDAGLDDVAFCATILTFQIRNSGAYADGANSVGTSGQVLSSTGSATAWVSPPVSSANSATALLGQTGAPAGACVNGSIYTRSDGTVGASHYDCYGLTWHAAAT
jgi:hypothetical protein